MSDEEFYARAYLAALMSPRPLSMMRVDTGEQITDSLFIAEHCARTAVQDRRDYFEEDNNE